MVRWIDSQEFLTLDGGGGRGKRSRTGPGSCDERKNVVFLFFILYFNFVYAFDFNIGKREPVGRKNRAVFCYFWNFTVERKRGYVYTVVLLIAETGTERCEVNAVFLYIFFLTWIL